MTDEEQREEAHRFETQARRDLQDIRDIRALPAFQRYFRRRLLTRQEELTRLFRYGKPEEVSFQEREIIRRILDELEALSGKLTSDESEAKVSIDRSVNG